MKKDSSYTCIVNGEDNMKKKLRLPILLLAVVIMLSIFYIKEARNKQPDAPVNGTNVETSTLNPEFTEARLLSIEEANTQIKEWEASIAGGNLTAAEVEATTKKINQLRETKHKEVALEESLMELNQYDDVLVLLGEEYLVIDIYTEEDIVVSKFIEMAKMAKQSFGSDCKVKVKTSSNLE